VRRKLEQRYICNWTRWLHLNVSAGHPRLSTKKILITSVIRVESCHASNRSNEYEFYVLLAYALGRRFRVIVWLLLCTESMCRFRKSVFVMGFKSFTHLAAADGKNKCLAQIASLIQL
jgi:hypothetical protein